jgi:hypothetical protein
MSEMISKVRCVRRKAEEEAIRKSKFFLLLERESFSDDPGEYRCYHDDIIGVSSTL